MDLTVRHAAFPSHPGAGHARHIDGYAWLSLIGICDFACTAAVLVLCSAVLVSMLPVRFAVLQLGLHQPG